jgi:DNA-binding LacI/PurR family transcriptional regulator
VCAPDTRQTTIRDVAKRAGVSVGTVSRALRGQTGLTEQRRQQILTVAQQVGYDLNRLRPGRFRRVLFLLHRQHATLQANPFYAPVLHGVEELCRSRGLALSYSSVGPGDGVGDLARLHEADGLLCVGFFEPEWLGELRQISRRLVLIDHFHEDFPSVNSDNLGGAKAAVLHLIHRGRRRIAFVSGPPQHYSIAQRRQGYLDALEQAGLPALPEYQVVRNPPEDELATPAAVQRLLALPNPPDAIFAYNDATAMIAMKVCQELGLSVPGDIAVAGFDDLAAAAQTSPSLTSVAVDKEALGREGMRLLLRQPHPGSGPIHKVIPVSLILRESSG